MDVGSRSTVEGVAPAQPEARSSLGHLPHVQGLRGIAVLLVVACHAGLGLPGGFVGVDVFFVISGFVISRGLLHELHTSGTIRLATFAARRARRLLPPLALVTVVGLAAMAVTVNPYHGQVLGLRTAATATLFVANGYLYRHVGYFDAASEVHDPFLHLWSLSVEEQVYLVLPTLLLLAWRLVGRRSAPPLGVRHRRLLVVVAATALGSFALAWACTSGRAPATLQAPVRFAFYAPPTRAWEFCAGILLALVEARWVRTSACGAAGATVLGVVGLVALLRTAVWLDPLAPFPGPAAAAPVVGGTLLLAAGLRPGPIGRLVAVGPLRWIGDRSYEWYLWHWPAIVLAGATWPGPGWVRPVAAVAALGLAEGTHRLFDRRVRRNPSLLGRPALALVAVCLLVPGLALAGVDAGIDRGMGLVEPDGWYDHPAGLDAGCFVVNRDLANRWDEGACTTGSPGARGLVLVLGDAWADGVTSGVVAAAATRGLAVAEWTRAGCPFSARPPVGYPRCAEWQDDALALVDRLHPVAVVVANRSPDYAGAPSGATPIATRRGNRTSSAAEARRAWGTGLAERLDDLERRGVPVVLVSAGPAFGDRFPRDRLSVIDPHPSIPELDRAEVADQRGAVLEVERQVVAQRSTVRTIDPVPELCEASCRPVQAGRWLYFEDQHLTRWGGERLAAPLGEVLDDLLAR